MLPWSIGNRPQDDPSGRHCLECLSTVEQCVCACVCVCVCLSYHQYPDEVLVLSAVYESLFHGQYGGGRGRGMGRLGQRTQHTFTYMYTNMCLGGYIFHCVCLPVKRYDICSDFSNSFSIFSLVTFRTSLSIDGTACRDRKHTARKL